MRILYLARFGQRRSNQDEEAIAHALTELGHEVTCVHEQHAQQATRLSADLLLINHWHGWDVLPQFKMPRVFYYFDLVTCPDPTLAARNRTRVEWMERTLPLVNLGFCTDGDFAATHPDKLICLRQGADERIAIPGTPRSGRSVDKNIFFTSIARGTYTDILFTGISRGGGTVRESFVAEMQGAYGSRFRHVTKGVYRRELADLIAGAKIVVAPDSPVTDHYFSNRCYVALGFGAFLLHPYCRELAEHYEDGKEIVFYTSRPDLHDKIRHYLERPEERQRIAAGGLARTRAEHLYRHRCERLIQTVKERLL